MPRRVAPSRLARQIGLLTAIPFVLLVGPALGYYVGNAADHRWHIAPWGMVIGVVFGFASSARVTAQFIKDARDASSDHTDQQ